MSALPLASITDVRQAQAIVHQFVSPTPLIRSYALEKELGLPPDRCVWIKDYGWSPVGSFKVLGALNWLATHAERIGQRPVAAHSSGNFAAGLAFAGRAFDKRVIIVMPEDAPRVKFERTQQLGAEIRTYDKAQDHITGERDRLTAEIAQQQQAVQASPYDDRHVIAGNGVGGLEIVSALTNRGRRLSHFVCAVSGGGLLAGHALAIADGFPEAQIIAVEPSGAADFGLSLANQQRCRLEQPQSICDGLLSYDIGEQNWPILRDTVTRAVAINDAHTCDAMRWLDEQHGLRSEPSGAISLAALLYGQLDLSGSGDIVIVLSGRNVDVQDFRKWTTAR
jgi:threonine dehydratase